MCKAFAIATVVALFAPSVPAFSQAVEIAPGGPDEALLFQGRSVTQPVSYTHLDVYKRQVPCRPCGESWSAKT